MIDSDELMDDLEENQEHLEAIIRRSKAHGRDINALQNALDEFEQDLQKETISPEESDDASGVAQS